MTLAAANAALWLLLLPLQARDLQELESAVTQSLRDIFQSASQQQSPAKYAAMVAFVLHWRPPLTLYTTTQAKAQAPPP